MSNYTDISHYSQVAQEAQLAHYGLPTGGAPRPHATKAGEYKGTIPGRKPVAARNQEGPYPSMTPTRKPVGGYRTVSSSSVRPQSPPPAKSGGYAGKNKPLPPTPRAPSTSQPALSAPPAPRPARPVAPKASASTTAVPARPLPLGASAATTPLPAQQRPGSSSGWSFRGRKRTDSNASNASNASGASTANKTRSRGGSFSSIAETAKKTGKWFSTKVEIVAMNPKERQNLFALSQRQHEQDLESKRRRGEMDHPIHQKQDFVRRSSGLDAVSSTVGVAGWEAHKEHKAGRQRRAAQYQKQHIKDCEYAQRAGKRRPSTPAGAKLSPPQRKDSFTPSMEDNAKARFGGVDPDANRPLPSAADKYAKILSEALDFVKPRQDSDASMWLSDSAPPASMDCCDKCGKAPKKALQGNRCEDCVLGHYFADVTDSPIIPMVPRKKGHNPKSLEDDAKGVDLYMRLPHHRLRKVRETMYEDPGNPFDFKSFEDPPLLYTAYVEDAGWETDNSETWPLSEFEVVQTSPRAQRDILSLFSDPFDLVNVHTDRETWSSFGSDRRSMSVDIGFLPMQGMMEGRRPSDFELSWPLSGPTINVQHPSGTLFTMDTKWGTKFYDFYDDLLAEYETEGNDNGTHHTQREIPIRFTISIVQIHHHRALIQDPRLRIVVHADEHYSQHKRRREHTDIAESQSGHAPFTEQWTKTRLSFVVHRPTFPDLTTYKPPHPTTPPNHLPNNPHHQAAQSVLPNPLLLTQRSPTMAPGGLRSMLVIECPWKKTQYSTSAVSAAHEPLSSPVIEVILDSWDRYEWQGSSDALTDWMNERWRKTGFRISKEVVCFTLRYHGREARMGLGDHLGETFAREG
ncbi:hypothetical protein Q7P35_011563 [Cladosporium inversicolor]